MRNHDEERLENAIQTLRSDAPDHEAESAATGRVAHRLGVQLQDGAAIDAIATCDDMQPLLALYRTGKLSSARSLLVEAHLHECGACLRRFRSQSGNAAVDWSAPKTQSKSARGFAWRPRAAGWALACAAGLAACSVLLYKAYWEVPPGVRAEVESIDGSAYVIAGSGDHRVAAGAKLQEGEHLRVGGGSRAVLRLADGSTVEANERSVLGVGARGRSLTVSLDDGAVIVQAAKRTSGHLYVRTPDCRVAVTGTVFSVGSGIKGSRVAVLQGTVHVMHAGVNSVLDAGEQMATGDDLKPVPLEGQIAWSQDREKYLQLVAQMATLQHRIANIPFPEPRYTSDLLNRMPADTLLYVSIPNLGDFLSEANTILHDQLSQSPELQQWWDHSRKSNTAEIDALVDKLHDVSQYLGDEVVIAGVSEDGHPGFAVLADVKRDGLDELLKTQFSSLPAGKLTVLDERTLASAPDAENEKGAYALLRPHEAIFSNSVATLRKMNAQLNAGSSGFAASEFGRQIAAAYSRGAGIILAADLHQVLANQADRIHISRAETVIPANRMRANEMMEQSGLEGVQYLIAEHRETNGVPENHLNLQFSGTRQRVASWLASPAPIESLDFVTPNAELAVAALSKDPKEIADDIVAMAAGSEGEPKPSLTEPETEIESTVRNDLVPNLGGDFLVALDGPVLPTPSWKVVIEVRDSAQVEQALERLTQLIDEQPHGKNSHPVSIEPSDVGSQRFYAVHDRSSGAIVAHYTFSDGFMIVAADRALLIEALRTHASGNSLARSDAFRALLPHDDNENYSAVAYQNLSPVLTPLLGQLKGGSADALRKLAEDSRPTAICAWGKENRIEASSDSRLFGFDFFTLGALLDSRNKSAGQNVKE
jgi:hypothetical protein